MYRRMCEGERDNNKIKHFEINKNYKSNCFQINWGMDRVYSLYILFTIKFILTHTVVNYLKLNFKLDWSACTLSRWNSTFVICLPSEIINYVSKLNYDLYTVCQKNLCT